MNMTTAGINLKPTKEAQRPQRAAPLQQSERLCVQVTTDGGFRRKHRYVRMSVR